MNVEKSNEIKGGYFPYCQYCKNDGSCTLTHNEFMGEAASGINFDISPFKHEDLSSGFTVFQRGNPKSACSGRIVENDSLYLPLSCEQCDTVISSLTMQALAGVHCLKFVPSTRIERIARKKGFETID